MKLIFPLALVLALSACSGAENASDNAAAGNVQEVPDITEVPVEGGEAIEMAEGEGNAALPTDAWIGHWTGPEGLVLDIQPGDGPGKYALAVTLLDGTDNYEGSANGDRIGFTRDGKAESVRKASGDETGLKYLAGKKDCLMIKEAEGFCRD